MQGEWNMHTLLRASAISIVLFLFAGQPFPGDAPGSSRVDDQQHRRTAGFEASKSPRPSEQPGPQAAPDEILVTFGEGLTESDCRATISGAGHTGLGGLSARYAARL